MDDLTQEILETIAAFQKKGRKKTCPLSGKKYIGVKFYEPAAKQYIEVRVPDPDFWQPAVSFENEYRLQGVAQQYRLPKGLSAVDLETYAVLLSCRKDLAAEQCHDKMTDLWSALIARNPTLKKIDFSPEDSAALFKMIMGVASAFNADDIQYFIRNFISGTENPELKMCASPEYKKLETVFNRYASNQKSPAAPKRELRLSWVASPLTLRLIRHQMMKRRAAQPSLNN